MNQALSTHVLYSKAHAREVVLLCDLKTWVHGVAPQESFLIGVRRFVGRMVCNGRAKDHPLGK